MSNSVSGSNAAGSGGGGAGANAGGGGTSGTFIDKIDPFKHQRSLKKKQKKSQGSSRYRTGGDAELQALPLLKGKNDNSLWRIWVTFYLE
jgi:hypothetical protein